MVSIAHITPSEGAGRKPVPLARRVMRYFGERYGYFDDDKIWTALPIHTRDS